MKLRPVLTSLERQILLGMPSLYPDGDPDDLKGLGADEEEISCAIETLIALGLAKASKHELSNRHMPVHRGLELSMAGEQLKRDLARSPLARIAQGHWESLLPTAIALWCALGLSLWNTFHPAK